MDPRGRQRKRTTCAAAALFAALALVGCSERGVTVQLASRDLVLDDATTREVDRALAIQDVGGGVHAIAAFPAPLTLTDIAALHDRGVTLLNRVDDRALLVAVDRPPVRDALGVDVYVGLVPPRDKLSANLRRRVDAEPGSPERIEALVQVHDDVDDADRIAALLPVGAEPWLGRTWRVALPLADVLDVATLDEVAAIEERPERRRSGEAGRKPTRTDEVAVLESDGSFTGRTGDGIRVGLIDVDGVDPNHPDLRTADGSAARVERFVPFEDPEELHGMSMAMAAVGNGQLSALAGFGMRGNRGHAPEARLFNVADVTDAAELLLDDDVHVVVTGDWLEKGGLYGIPSSEVDRLVRGDTFSGTQRLPGRPHVWAAGNEGFDDGYQSLMVASKSAIVVGSTDADDDGVSLFSSLGPTQDGRLKPDVVAPGAMTTGVSLDGGLTTSGLIFSGPGALQPYAKAWGSSFAAPAVAGILALVMEELEAIGRDPRTVAPSTYRALLAATATDLSSSVTTAGGGTITYHAGPDHPTGHGLVDAVEAIAAISEPLRWSEMTLVEPGQRITSTITVPAGDDELVVALAWDDRPGSTWASAPALVHDLDVQVVSPFGQTVFPATVEPPTPNSLPKPATIVARDARNTLEVVRVGNPPEGQWIVHVEAKWLGLGCSQVASLVTSHPHLRIAWLEPLPLIPDPKLQWIAELVEPPSPFEAPRADTDGANDLVKTWLWPQGSVLPLDVLVVPPQVCLVWTVNPLVELILDDLPPDTVPLPFDERGALEADVERSGDRVRLRFTRRDVTRPAYLALTDAAGRPWPQDLRPRITVRSPPPTERRR